VLWGLFVCYALSGYVMAGMDLMRGGRKVAVLPKADDDDQAKR
jgi:hypothetical protein